MDNSPINNVATQVYRLLTYFTVTFEIHLVLNPWERRAPISIARAHVSIMHFIVATDGSDESEEAIRYSTHQATALDAALEVVHVLTPQTELIDGEIVMPGGDRAVEYGEQTLEKATGLIADVLETHDTTLDVETTLLAGHPSNAITDHADDVGADAIYIGHRGLSSERERLVGSVAKSVVDKSTVPVTICR